jgi:hypothetical protein
MLQVQARAEAEHSPQVRAGLQAFLAQSPLLVVQAEARQAQPAESLSSVERQSMVRERP